MRISDWSSDVCSSDLPERFNGLCNGSFTRVRIAHIGMVKRRNIASLLDLCRGLMACLFFNVDDHEPRTLARNPEGRSAERREGKECVSTCRSRWSPYP